MQSTNLKEIKAALWDQAFIGRTWVSCSMGRVVGIRRRKGQLLAMVYGWGRWYPVENVTIEVLWTRPIEAGTKLEPLLLLEPSGMENKQGVITGNVL